MEFNPDHPVTEAIHDNWHKLCASVMHKLGREKVTISIADIEEFAALPEMPVMLCHDHDNVIDLILLPESEARKMAAKQGAKI